MLYVPVNNFLAISVDFLGLTSTKQVGLKCVAQGPSVDRTHDLAIRSPTLSKVSFGCSPMVKLLASIK